MSRQPPSMQEDLSNPDRMRKIQEWMDGTTVEERLDQATDQLGSLQAIADLFRGQFFEQTVDAAGTVVLHEIDRIPTAILWYEPTTPGNWLRRTVGGDEVMWTRQRVYLTAQVTEVYRFILI